jgi:ABC-type transporter Mla subunit MlaD
MPHHTQPAAPLSAPTLGAPTLAFWREEAEGFEARLHDVLAALDEAGVDLDDKLEEGDAVRALAAQRDAFRSALKNIASRADYLSDLVDAVREELGLLEVHDDAEVLRELAALKALRVPA